jgi:hypothetical protein
VLANCFPPLSDRLRTSLIWRGGSSAVASPFPVPNSSKRHELEMTKKIAPVVCGMTSSSSMPMLTVAKDGNTKVLPFEFRALEVCLESACRSLEEEVCANLKYFLRLSRRN